MDEMDGPVGPEVSGMRHVLGDLGLVLVPAGLLSAHLLRPDVTVLRLGAVAAVLAVAHIWCESLYAAVMSGGTAREFTLHFGHCLLVVVIGTVVAVWWGWRSTAVVVALDCAWQGLGGLLDRTMLERLPRTTRQPSTMITRLPPGKE